MKKGKIVLFGLAALAVASIGGTWAAWTAYQETANEYMVPKYKTSLEEKFTRPDDWQPGISMRKEVWVSNDVRDENGERESAVPVIAKVEFHQQWVRRETIYEMDANGNKTPVDPVAGKHLPPVFVSDEGVSQYAAVPNFNKEAVVVLSSGVARDEGLSLGLPVVENPAEARGKWLLVEEEPNEIGNYIFYYVGVLQPGESTPMLLQSVTMNPLMEATIATKDTSYRKRPDNSGYDQITVTNRNSKYGYDGCTYTMDIEATTVQATKAAVEKTFDDGRFEKVIYYLANEVADPGVYDHSDLAKVLTLVNTEGEKLEYIPYRSGDGKEIEEGNWFMSFVDMVPGGIYKDTLKVENMTKNRRARIYMRIRPREQEPIKDELLEKITMKIWFEDEMLYEGKVTGAKYGNGRDFHELLPLCYLRPGESGVVKVEMQLDPTITCDPDTGECIYADQLSKIDWEFMCQGSNGGGGGGNGGGGGGGGSGEGGPGGNPPTTDIPDGGVPTTFLDDGEVPLASMMIPDEDVPLAALLPETGDTRPVVLLAVLSATSLMLLAALGIQLNKERQRKQK